MHDLTTQTLKTLEMERTYAQEAQGRFHAHLTVRVNAFEVGGLMSACQPLGAKATLIDLSNMEETRAQRDVMVTHHAYDPRAGAVPRLIDDLVTLTEALDASGYPVERVKLEQEGPPAVPRFDQRNYHEVHVKLYIPSAEHPEAMAWLAKHAPRLGVAPSRNPRQRTEEGLTRFLNMRIYEGDLAEADARVEALLAELKGARLDVVEVKRETVVFDTNRGVDQWWA